MKLTIHTIKTVIGIGLACVLGERAQGQELELEQHEYYSIGGVHPRISPLGKQLALSWQGSIGLFDIGGGTLKVLSRGEGWDIEPVWSPDGKKIAFFNTSNFGGGILKMIDAISGKEISLPAKINGYGKLFFHPDGKQLLGYLQQGKFPTQPAWLNLDTGKITPLALSAMDQARLKRKGLRFALSHDGKSILYVIHLDEPDQQTGNNGPMADVWMADADGGNAKKLFQWPARIYDLEWGVDKDSFVAVTDLGSSHNDLWRIPLKKRLKSARKLTFGQADEDRPSLSSNGESMVYSDNKWGATGITVRDYSKSGDQSLRATAIDWGEPTGQLRLNVSNGPDGKPLTIRVSLKRQKGKFFAPPHSIYRLTQGRGHFYTSGTELILPAGKYDIVANRGPEYRPFELTVSIEADKKRSVDVNMSRWVNMAEQGWYSGENHVHANYGYGEWYNTPETMIRQCLGENLNICNAVVANSDGNGVFDREFFLGKPDPQSGPETILYWNQEFRATLWGHLTLFDLSQLVEPVFTGFPYTTNPWDVPTNADVAQETTDQKGIVSYTHPAGNPKDLYDQPYSSKGLPMDAALGRVDVMDVMGSTYEGSMLLWHKLLNCGFRIPAAAGTDCFLNRVRSYPPGWGRVYVRVPGKLTYRGWVDGLKKGHAFVSNGPTLAFSVNGKQMGEEIELKSPREVDITASAQSQFPMENAELIFNGKVVRKVELAEDQLSASFDGKVDIKGSGWLAFRVRGPGGKHIIGRSLVAHSNPIYVTVPGFPIDSSQDAEYFLNWIDRLEKQFRERDRVPNDRMRQHVLGQLNSAREVYQALKTGR